jgi:predicted Zn-dependent peptidase
MKNARASFAEEKQELLKKRREYLRNKNTTAYKELVMEMIQKEEKVGTDLLGDAMEHIGLSEQEFMQTH